MMKKARQLALIVLALGFAGFACQFLPDFGDDPTSNGDDSTNNGDDSFDPDILFQDDFSSPSSGWEDTYRDESGMTDYDQGGFRIQVLQDNFDYWANPEKYYSDTVIEVDARKIGGPEDNNFGVICRYQDLSNFYFMYISSDGFYGIGKYRDGEQTIIGADSLLETDQINPGEQTNRIQADCIGNTLRLYVNGSLLTEVFDSDFLGGDVGLIAGTYDIPGTDILFDNFVVRNP